MAQNDLNSTDMTTLEKSTLRSDHVVETSLLMILAYLDKKPEYIEDEIG